MSPRASARLLCALAAAGLLAAACGSEPRPKREPQPLVVPGTAKVSEVQPTPDEVPVPEDFAAEVEREITAANWGAQLDALERELSTNTAPPTEKLPAQQAR